MAIRRKENNQIGKKIYGGRLRPPRCIVSPQPATGCAGWVKIWATAALRITGQSCWAKMGHFSLALKGNTIFQIDCAIKHREEASVEGLSLKCGARSEQSGKSCSP